MEYKNIFTHLIIDMKDNTSNKTYQIEDILEQQNLYSLTAIEQDLGVEKLINMIEKSNNEIVLTDGDFDYIIFDKTNKKEVKECCEDIIEMYECLYSKTVDIDTLSTNEMIDILKEYYNFEITNIEVIKANYNNI